VVMWRCSRTCLDRRGPVLRAHGGSTLDCEAVEGVGCDPKPTPEARCRSRWFRLKGRVAASYVARRACLAVPSMSAPRPRCQRRQRNGRREHREVLRRAELLDMAGSPLPSLRLELLIRASFLFDQSLLLSIAALSFSVAASNSRSLSTCAMPPRPRRRRLRPLPGQRRRAAVRASPCACPGRRSRPGGSRRQ